MRRAFTMSSISAFALVAFMAGTSGCSSDAASFPDGGGGLGGSGGSVDANLDRWLGQMEQADGKPSKAVAKTATMTTNGLKVTVLDVSGR